MSNSYDAILVGLGAMGSAAAYHLTRRGARVLGLDRFHPPHQLGSSHGLTRIIREAYFEHPAYAPLVQRAYELWGNLEKDSLRKLLLKTGGLMIGQPAGVLVTGARHSAEQHNLQHALLSSAELRRRYPVFQPEDNMVAVWEPRAGILFPELAIQTHLELAAVGGASLRFNEPVERWEPDGQGVRVFTAKGTYTAPRLLLAAGAWIGDLLQRRVPDSQTAPHGRSSSPPRPRQHFAGNQTETKSSAEINLPLSIERQVLFWFEPRSQAELFQPENCPIHIWEYAPNRFFYGFPELGCGVKVAIHHEGETIRPQHVRREISDGEIQAMRSILRRFIPAADGSFKSAMVCMYTNTPDQHFILDFHPAYLQVLLASPCSGHGFKFSSVIGELVANLLTNNDPQFDLSLFKIRPGRFSD